MVWIADASPLVVLGGVGLLDVLAALPTRLVVPEAVRDEVMRGPVDDRAREWLSGPAGALVRRPDPIPSSVALRGLGAGETGVFAAALALPEAAAVLDDDAARRFARSLGIYVIGTGRVLIEAKRAGRIAKVGPFLSMLALINFHMSPALRQEILRLAGE